MMAAALLRKSGFATARVARAVPATTVPPLRVVLVAGCVAASGVAAWIGDPAAYLQADPALGRLLRGMALIKGVIALAALGAVWWRFGWGISRAAAATYLISCGAMTGATVLIWQLSHILAAAALFHAAAVSLLWVGWREK